jgi:hypothetical protein
MMSMSLDRNKLFLILVNLLHDLAIDKESIVAGVDVKGG